MNLPRHTPQREDNDDDVRVEEEFVDTSMSSESRHSRTYNDWFLLARL
jgi:hypothetical protein